MAQHLAFAHNTWFVVLYLDAADALNGYSLTVNLVNSFKNQIPLFKFQD